MSPALRTLTASFTTLALAGCFGSAAVQRNGDRNGSPDEEKNYGAATVISSDELGTRSVSLLQMLRYRVKNMRVSPSSTCPQVVLRGQKTLAGASNAQVYLDGVRTVNTCILNGINTADVSRVEIYPNGVSSRPGYVPYPYGLILVFTKRANVPS